MKREEGAVGAETEEEAGVEPEEGTVEADEEEDEEVLAAAPRYSAILTIVLRCFLFILNLVTSNRMV